jgi:hypothetical protein
LLRGMSRSGRESIRGPAGRENETLSVRPKRSRPKMGRDLEEKNYGDQDLQTDHTDAAL